MKLYLLDFMFVIEYYLKKLDVSSYEAWNGIKSNLNYFKVQECVSFYKVFYPQIKKLESRGLNSVFIGHAQNSKVYRLLDLETNEVVEYVHVKFIKNKFINNSNVQELYLKLMIHSLSKKHKNL